PWDVIHHVVLLSDVPVLRQLALVSRHLLPHCRRRLFHAIRFEQTTDDIDSLCKFLEANPLLPLRVHEVTIYHGPELLVGQKRRIVGPVFPHRLLRMIPRLCHWKFSFG
ncbi:hypothetical protein LXA43DRAFT_868406, partial [Ganoderma leucocontextum]